MSPKIFRLSEQTINQIAAGEVIENPASVLKELIENAIDAGASQIHIETLGGGFEFLRVSDNGCGMSPEDAALCCERHATSKIKAVDDLNFLDTMGFRGEALASIGAVSQMTLLTSQDGNLASRLEIHGGKVVDIRRGSRVQGTTLEVRFLFYNVPARKKFQKSERASTAEITKVITQLALAHPECGFELTQAEEKVLSFSKGEGLISRIARALDGNFEDGKPLPLQFSSERWSVHGVIGSPLCHRPNRLGQYLFINRRPVISASLSFAIREAFGTRLDRERHPLYVLHLTIPPEDVDVNVHPQKKEVRLSSEKFLKEQLQKAVLSALQQENLYCAQKEVLNLDASNTQSNLSEAIRWSGDHCEVTFDEDRFINLNPFSARSISPVQPVKELPAQVFSWEYPKITAEEFFDFPVQLKERQVVEEKQLQAPLTLQPCVLGLLSSYLLVDAVSISKGEGLLLVDLEAACEKIAFDLLLTKKEEGGVSQGLLIPITLSLNLKESAFVSDHLEGFKQIGLEARMLGKTALCIEAVPACIPLDAVQGYVRHLIGEESGEDFEALALRTAHFMRRAKKVFTLEEGVEILKKLLQLKNPKVGPLGKSIMVCVGLDEIKRRFN